MTDLKFPQCGQRTSVPHLLKNVLVLGLAVPLLQSIGCSKKHSAAAEDALPENQLREILDEYRNVLLQHFDPMDMDRGPGSRKLTSIQRRKARTEARSRAQAKLVKHRFRITVVVKDVSLSDKNQTVISFSWAKPFTDRGSDVLPISDQEREAFGWAEVMLGMSESQALNIHIDDKLGLAGNVHLSDSEEETDAAGIRFYYKGIGLVLTAISYSMGER